MKTTIVIFLLIIVCLPTAVIGQTRNSKSDKKTVITGFVIDVYQNPVAGAAIVVDKRNTGSVTDDKGYFEVSVRTDAEMISVFLYNNKIAEEKIEGRTAISLNLKETDSSKDDQENNTTGKPVNVGYGDVNPDDLTVPVSKLDVKDNKYDSYPDIYEMLRGTVPGVQVTGKSINIRGSFSLNLSTEPLFVVNGIQVSSIDNINPSEVKSIEVLKGSAASIYGSRGSNGVILINLKTGNDR